jgi:hypothetical protein
MYTVTIRDEEKTFNSLSDIDDSTRQEIAQEYVNSHYVHCQNSQVEFILKVAHEYPNNAPFSYDDIENNVPFGSVTVGNVWRDLTEQERDDLLPIYEYLRDKAEVMHEKITGQEPEDINSEQWQLWEKKEQRIAKLFDRYDLDCDNLETMDFENWPEVYQWFLCDERLIHQLNKRGEVTLNGEYWGRQTFGQSIVLDSVIQEIAIDLLVTKD